MTNPYKLAPECEPFIDDYAELREAYDYCAFHDDTLCELRYIKHDNGLVDIEFATENVRLLFANVHGYETSIPDIRSSYFYGIDFYVANWCDYGRCIVMETDGDNIKIVAERIKVLEA